ncbi:MAG: hypothetical protein CL758_06970 [Chloroflexi bacterium]|nr:hypothetical protein [Chloroflexota bacterium]|tara:strand:+ start:555 stop:1544 length:990 start_codon:yes stop_codon:yes gene_type:complete
MQSNLITNYSFWKNKIVPFSLIAISVFLIVYVILGFYGLIGLDQTSSSNGSVSRWCERISTGIFKEPINSLSNLGFIISGLLMLCTLSRDSTNKYKVNNFHGLTPISLFYAGSVVYLGIGSLLMHGTNTHWGGWADNLSMIMYIILPWLINIGEMGKWSVRKFIRVYIVLVLIYAWSRWLFGSSLGINLDLFGLSIGLWIISESLFRFWSLKFRCISGFVGFVVAAVFGITPLEIFTNIDKYWWIVLFWIPGLFSFYKPIKKRKYFPWFFLGMIMYVLSFIVWVQGKPGSPYCNPDSFIQLHAVWHLMTAFSTYCFFKFFRTEKLIVNE